MPIEPTAAESVAGEILAYLLRRPSACDTLDGILQWWLPRIRLEEATETVQEALALLEQRQLIDRIALAAGPVVYRRREQAAAAFAAPQTAPLDQRNTP
jgi:hypothetical protein